MSKLVENEGSRFLELFGSCNNKDEEGQLTEDSIPKVLTLFIEKIPLLFEQGTNHGISSNLSVILTLSAHSRSRDLCPTHESFAFEVIYKKLSRLH